MSKRSQSLFDEIHDQARVDRAHEEAAGKSEAQARASLEKKGVDIGAALAKLDAAVAQVEANAEAPPKRSLDAADALYDRAARPAREPKRSSPAVPFAAGIATAAAAAFVLYVAVPALSPIPPVVPPHTAGTPPGTTEADLDRFEAYGALVDGDYEACLRKLDDAKRLDPDGDARPRVQRARQQAAAGLAQLHGR